MTDVCSPLKIGGNFAGVTKKMKLVLYFVLPDSFFGIRIVTNYTPNGNDI